MDFIIGFFIGIPLYIFLSWGYDKLFRYQYFTNTEIATSYDFRDLYLYDSKNNTTTIYYLDKERSYFMQPKELVEMSNHKYVKEIGKKEFNKYMMARELLK